LPNPDRPYVKTSGTVVYDSPAIARFEFWATNPSQLNMPSPVSGGYSFDSTFDVAFEAQMSFALEPFHTVSGVGTARARGFAPGGSEPVLVFDTELLTLDLVGTSPIRGSFMLRESPTLSSTGVTRVEGGCFSFICPAIAVVLPMRISSYFDVFTEISTNGGVSWTPARDNEAMHVVQLPEPASGILALCALSAGWAAFQRRGLPMRNARLAATGRRKNATPINR
ncbi:MAG TPA: hypothetical protein VHK01_07335, partial [Lacipirellulaceae bacterium]|nr:hypothetical protein [Lacipirellulaceae bacterium]